MSLKNIAALLGAGDLPAFPNSPSTKQRAEGLETPDWLDKMSPGPPAHWKKGRAVGTQIQTSETVHFSVINGFGKVVYPDGSVYVGNMKNRTRDGEGCFQYADGGEYLGQWLGGKKHGIGVMIFPSEAKYAGEWKLGMRHGYGRYDWHPIPAEQEHLRSPSDVSTFHESYIGQWENDKMSGLGRLESAYGSLDIGNFSNGKLHGYGMRILKSRPKAASAASILSGDVLFGKRQVFVGFFESDEFFGPRNREAEAAYQLEIEQRRQQEWNPFDVGNKKTNSPPDGLSPKKFPRMNETQFDAEVAAEISVSPLIMRKKLQADLRCRLLSRK
jgi:hypothetical protein